jgi:hypothetical protein
MYTTCVVINTDSMSQVATNLIHFILEEKVLLC